MPSIAATTSLTRSQGCGDITFATCGANAGEERSTSKVVPSATISPSAMKMTLFASSATSSTAAGCRLLGSYGGVGGSGAGGPGGAGGDDVAGGGSVGGAGAGSGRSGGGAGDSGGTSGTHDGHSGDSGRGCTLGNSNLHRTGRPRKISYKRPDLRRRSFRRSSEWKKVIIKC